MSSVLIVNEITSERRELAQSLEAEGFQVMESASASDAVRDIWEGSYVVVFIASVLEGTNANQLARQLKQLAPEIETIIHSKSDTRNRLVKKAIEIRDGVAA